MRRSSRDKGTAARRVGEQGSVGLLGEAVVREDRGLSSGCRRMCAWLPGTPGCRAARAGGACRWHCMRVHRL